MSIDKQRVCSCNYKCKSAISKPNSATTWLLYHLEMVRRLSFTHPPMSSFYLLKRLTRQISLSYCSLLEFYCYRSICCWTVRYPSPFFKIVVKIAYGNIFSYQTTECKNAPSYLSSLFISIIVSFLGSDLSWSWGIAILAIILEIVALVFTVLASRDEAWNHWHKSMSGLTFVQLFEKVGVSQQFGILNWFFFVST